MTHRFSAPVQTMRLLAAVLLTAGLFVLTPAPRAQGTLTAPAGQSRVTAPGGLRGRAALRLKARNPHKARHRTMRHRRHR